MNKKKILRPDSWDWTSVLLLSKMCDSEHIYFTFLTLASPSGKWGFVPSSMGSFKDYLKDYLWSCNYNSSLQGIDCLVREISSRRGKWALALGTWQRIDLRWEGQKPRWVLKDSPGLLGAENGILRVSGTLPQWWAAGSSVSVKMQKKPGNNSIWGSGWSPMVET